jgi:anti-anti-sigma factor
MPLGAKDSTGSMCENSHIGKGGRFGGADMQFTINDAGSTATLTMVGRLDIPGAEVIALPLATLAGSKKGLFIDMAGVTFIASIGLRHLVLAAKAIGRRSGRVVLLNPNGAVAETIAAAGLADLLSIERGDTSQS